MRTSRSKRSTRTLLIALVAAPVAAMTLAACGSTTHTRTRASASSHSTGSSASAVTRSSSPLVAFAKCMRANGVPNFPDQGHGGIEIDANPTAHTLTVDGITIGAPAYQVARAKCQKDMPHQSATPAQQAQARASILRFSKCMRGHGVRNFPDPKFINGPDGNQRVDLPGINPQSPAFQTAAKACGGGPKK